MNPPRISELSLRLFQALRTQPSIHTPQCSARSASRARSAVRCKLPSERAKPKPWASKRSSCLPQTSPASNDCWACVSSAFAPSTKPSTNYSEIRVLNPRSSAAKNLHDEVVSNRFLFDFFKSLQISSRHERIRPTHRQRHLRNNPPLDVRQERLVNLRAPNHKQIRRQRFVKRQHPLNIAQHNQRLLRLDIRIPTKHDVEPVLQRLPNRDPRLSPHHHRMSRRRLAEEFHISRVVPRKLPALPDCIFAIYCCNTDNHKSILLYAAECFSLRRSLLESAGSF